MAISVPEEALRLQYPSDTEGGEVVEQTVRRIAGPVGGGRRPDRCDPRAFRLEWGSTAGFDRTWQEVVSWSDRQLRWLPWGRGQWSLPLFSTTTIGPRTTRLELD